MQRCRFRKDGMMHTPGVMLLPALIRIMNSRPPLVDEGIAVQRPSDFCTPINESVEVFYVKSSGVVLASTLSPAGCSLAGDVAAPTTFLTISVGAMLLASWILNRLFFRGEPGGFVMELPPTADPSGARSFGAPGFFLHARGVSRRADAWVLMSLEPAVPWSGVSALRLAAGSVDVAVDVAVSVVALVIG
jgi:hypothetical protein